MCARVFTADEAWFGGFYELAIEVGPRSDDRMRAALSALWSHPDLDGCFIDRGRGPCDQPRVPPDSNLETGSHMLGVANLPNGRRIACGTCLIREEDGPDWLDFYLPMASLGTAYPVAGFPFGSEADWPGPWRREVEDWLAEVGLWTARSLSFRLALIGFEVSGQVYAADVGKQDVPAKRFIGYLWPSGDKVVYYPRTASLEGT